MDSTPARLPKKPDKTCSGCGTIIPNESLVVDGTNRNGTPHYLRGRCKPCWQKQERDARWKRQYGLLPGEYEILLAGQGGVCAICKRPPVKHRLSVDHNHITGVTRGLLCGRCNRLLGWAFERVDVLTNAAAYLTLPPITAILNREVVGKTGRINKHSTAKTAVARRAATKQRNNERKTQLNKEEILNDK